MISCAAIQRLERYGALGLKRHSTEDFITTSLKDARRANIYALTLQETWREAAQALRGGGIDVHATNTTTAATAAATATATAAQFTDALVYAASFAVALTSQHLFSGIGRRGAADVRTASRPTPRQHGDSSGSGGGGVADVAVLSNLPGEALLLLTAVKDAVVAMNTGRQVQSCASSAEATKAMAHLLMNGTDLLLLLLHERVPASNATQSKEETQRDADQQDADALLAQALVLVAAVAQMLRRVQASYPMDELYHTRPCAAVLKTLANKHKQLQQRCGGAGDGAGATRGAAALPQPPSPRTTPVTPPLLALLHRYVQVCAVRRPGAAGASSSTAIATAAGVFSVFSLFQRLSMLHGALAAVAALPGAVSPALRAACMETQRWLSRLVSTIACNRATRFVVYFRGDELRLMQQNIRQSSDYALFTFAATPPVDPGLVEALLQTGSAAAVVHHHPISDAVGGRSAVAQSIDDAVSQARAALVLAQWCVTAPFLYESFCQDESWASFAQEQRRLALLQQSRARRGLEKTSSSSSRQQQRRRSKAAPSASSSASDDGSASVRSDGAESLSSHHAQSHLGGGGSIGGSVTSLASRVSLLSTLSRHSAASYLSFISVLRPSTTAGSVTGRGGNGEDEDNGDGSATATAAGDGGGARQLHESEDGNTNLPLILLEQLTLGLHRFMEAHPAALLDHYGLRSVAWDSIARLFAIVAASLANTTGTALSATSQQQQQQQRQQLFHLGQDVRFNRGMGYECLGVVFAKVVAPLLDTSRTPAASGEATVAATATTTTTTVDGGTASGHNDSSSSSSVGAGHSDGDRTEGGFFANAAANATTVGRAVLVVGDDDATRAAVEAALSTCLTTYETVAPQVVDMNLSTILRLAARAAAAAANANADGSASSTSHAALLENFVRDVIARIGRSNDLPHFADALLGRGSSAAAAAGVDSNASEAAALRGLRAVLALPAVRRATVEAAATSLDPESLLLHLSSIAAELEDSHGDRKGDASVQRVLLALEVMEACLAGVTPTSVSASAVLEQTTQLEMLLASSALTAVAALKSASDDDGDGAESTSTASAAALVLQHLRTIYHCRGLTRLCLQDLGTAQVHDYLRMLEEALWQVSSHVGGLVGSLTLLELQPLLDAVPSSLAEPLLLPSLVLQRLSLARAVGAALGVEAGPAEELHAMVAYMWDCLGRDGDGATSATTTTTAAAGAPRMHRERTVDVPLSLANEMPAEEWVSLTALGKPKHARRSMTALLLRSATVQWLSRCLRGIPGTVLRALVDAFVSLPVAELCGASATAAQQQQRQWQWRALSSSLLEAYAVVGHNPYWPAVVAHAADAVVHVAKTWRRHGAAGPCAALAHQLLTTLACTLRSEPSAADALRRMLLTLAREAAAPAGSPVAPALSRRGMSIAYVETIKVPATSIMDLSAPVDGAEAAAAAADTIAALRGLTFEDELRDLCVLLVSPAFVKRLFDLVDLCSGTTTATVHAGMSTLARLHHIAVGAAQASWRARTAESRADALAQSPAVQLLHAVAHAFHTRGVAADAGDAVSYAPEADAALISFLQHFRGGGGGDACAEQPLLVHVALATPAAAAAAASRQPRRRPRDTGDVSGGADAAEEAVSPASVWAGALRAVAELWRERLRSAMGTVVRLSTVTEAAAASLQTACVTLRLLFACVWTCAPHAAPPQQHGAKSNGAGGRRMRAFVADHLSSHNAVALLRQLGDLFPSETATTTAAAVWWRLVHIGGEAGACALWLLWAVESAAAARGDGVTTAAEAQLKASLQAHYGSCLGGSPGDVATALRAATDVLRVLPAEEATPLFHHHVDHLLSLPATSAPATTAAAAELVVHLFSLRPRLPAARLLPHAQRLLAQLSHACAEPAAAGSPRLTRACVQVCAAVAAHPAVASSSVGDDGHRLGAELLDTVWLLLMSVLGGTRGSGDAAASSSTLPREEDVLQVITLLTTTWLRRPAHQPVLWSRPAMLPPLLCAVFACVMDGLETRRYSPRALNVLASGLAAMAADVDAATASEVDPGQSMDSDDDGGDDVTGTAHKSGGEHEDVTRRGPTSRQRRRLETGVAAAATAAAVPAHVKRAALAAATAALLQVSQHHVHVFTAFSGDMDVLFTDLLRLLRQHLLPTVARPPIAHRAGVRISGTTQSEMSFADLVYTCVGSTVSKSLLRQAALRMEEEEGQGDGGAPALTDGNRSLFRVT
ncbi:hypothetical protein NESM_000253800 [Novymonas esmeraldas]|uniref:Uncharacterized protein n=1 Tax=Novymonas esmeraldas TaxID=1808958 RepID=A0AAW0F753_9TRYP